jgi:hypothetical protein
VIDKEIHFRTVIFDIPGEDIRIGGLEHHFIKAQGVDEFTGNIRAPGPYRFSYSASAMP